MTYQEEQRILDILDNQALLLEAVAFILSEPVNPVDQIELAHRLRARAEMTKKYVEQSR